VKKRIIAGAAGLTATLVAAGGLYAATASAEPAPAAGLVSAAERAGEPRAKDGAAKRHGKDRRLRGRRVIGLHGETTVRRQGEFVVVRFQRGQVTEASATALTVRSADGATWKWTLDDATRVRRHGEKSEAGKLAKGDWAFVAGPKDGGQAKLVLVPKRPPRDATAPSPN
jgi:hypothetical protein